MELERLNAFLAVAREKTFTRAAETLFRTQPAVSQSIRLLEEDLGEPLFLRLGRSAVLTEAGQILLEHVNQAFDAFDQGRIRIQALKELREGRLSISASDTTTCFILPDILRLFRDRYPGIELRILNRPSPEAARQVADRETDIGIVTLPIDHPKLKTEAIVAREDVAICAPSHSLASRSRIAFRDLLSYPLLLLDQGSNTRRFFDTKLAETGLVPDITMELGSIEVIKKMVEMDFGVSIVPHIAVVSEVSQGKLGVLHLFGKTECRQLGFVYPSKGVLPLAARVFMKLMKASLSATKML